MICMIFDNIVVNMASLRATFGTRFNVDVGHILLL